jgi:hypothetical protein
MTLVKMKFDSISDLIQWQKASDSILRGRVVEVGFVHRGNCPHIVGYQRAGAPQDCPCKPTVSLMYS